VSAVFGRPASPLHMVYDPPWSPSFDTAIRSNGFGDLVLKSRTQRAQRALSPLNHGATSRASGSANLQ
jgi:hypothetical protein